MDLTLIKISAAVYGLSTGLFLAHLINARERFLRAARYTLFGGFAVHAVAILLRYLSLGLTPVTNVHEGLSFFAWILVGGALLVQGRFRVRTLGAFVTPLALVLTLISIALSGGPDRVPDALRSAWLPIHVSMAFLGDAAFGLAAVAGAMYLLQERQVKQKRLGGLFRRLPSLETLDTLNRRFLLFGFPLLTLGIVTGALWAESAWGSYWSWEPRETWSLITWICYAGVLHARIGAGWRGRRVALLTIAGFAVLVGSFLFIKLIDPGTHGGEFRG